MCSIDIFNESVQPLFSLMSQILGLDDERPISEVILGFLVKFCKSEEQIKCINFDKFLVEKIHSQLMNFHTEKCFICQTLLLLMVIHPNLAELQEQDPIQFVDDFYLSPNISFFDFSNKIMAKIYQFFLRLNYLGCQKK